MAKETKQISVEVEEFAQLVDWCKRLRSIVSDTEENVDNPEAVRANCNQIREILDEIDVYFLAEHIPLSKIELLKGFGRS
jgi:hypothetical protein